MVLALLTYARLDSYLALSGTQKEFENYMQLVERHYINAQAEDWYDQTHLSSNSASKGPRTAAKARISWDTIVHNDKRTKDPQFHEQMRSLSKALMMILFRNEQFFRKAVEEDAHVLDELLNAIQEAADLFPLSLSKTSDLANLDLGNEKLQNLFFLVLNGYTPQSSKPEKPRKEDEGEDEEESQVAQSEAEERHGQDIKISLLDFITTQKNDKIRVFLAPRPLLLAIFKDPAIAEEIDRTRMELYANINQGGDVEEARKVFERFKGRAPGIDENRLDFSVTKVNPRKYDISL